MAYTNIRKQTTLNKKFLDPHHYTLSLIEEGCRIGLIDGPTMNIIKSQLMSLLKDLIIKYTHGESTSVKVETAQSILLSVFYSIDALMFSFNNPEDAIGLLRSDNIAKIYKKSFDIVSLCLEETKSLFHTTKNNKLDFPVKAYHSTIDEALPDFFNNYDIMFKAQDTMASMDYPLLFDDMSIKGIYYIKQYLEKLEIETHFCRMFAKNDINHLLFNYGRAYGLDYREALINVFEIVLTNSIFSVLSDSNVYGLSISPVQHANLQKKFNSLAPSQCSSLINEGIENLLRHVQADQPQLRDYISNFKSVLMPRFLIALTHNNLANVIIIDGIKEAQLDITFNEGQRMNDDSFRRLISQLRECTEVADKNQLIKSNIHSLGDFIDVLEAECFYGNEYKALFNSLGDIELSILARIVFSEELRSDSTGFILSDCPEIPTDMEWKSEYAYFLSSLTKKRLSSINRHINSSLQANIASGHF